MSPVRRRPTESDRLLRRIGVLVRETEALRRRGASRSAVEARWGEVERLKARLADVVRRDPTAGAEGWGRIDALG